MCYNKQMETGYNDSNGRKIHLGDTLKTDWGICKVDKHGSSLRWIFKNFEMEHHLDSKKYII